MEPRSYGPFPYTPITRRPKITWPNGAKLALLPKKTRAETICFQ